ncbi:MFS transporter [Curtobacterium sp. MCBD17_035]|uniref:MFS transporter n=1 Tax=Curtobacterium sp. MCBD17_035 TaxID=2175673 RepID=UPI000DA7017A|nr:MFS transporter [Curtobacterium sp. MCBD17_035]WIB67393.1 MFS transporter [Curtobacterium sp. MCBD17_035]
MTTARSLLSSVLGPFRSTGARYGRVLDHPGALAFFLPAAVARLGVAMTGLGLLFSIQHASGSFAVAGASTAGFSIAEAVAGPQVARLVDRWGQTVTVPVIVATHAAAVAAAITTAGSAPVPVTLAAVMVAGAVTPQPGALSAARWSHLLTDGPALRVAFSLEANVNDVVFLSGPILVTLASTSLVPWAGSAAAATLVALGCGTLSLQPRTAPAPRRGRGRGRNRTRTSLLAPDFLAALGVNLGLGCFFGAVPLLVTAAASARGMLSLTGLVLAVPSAASIIAGLVYGSMRATPRPQAAQLVATLVLTVAVLVGVAWPTLLGLAIMLAIGGTAIAPLLASSSQIVQATVAGSALTQGFTWINSASAIGIAMSASLAGALITHGGVRVATMPLVVLVLATVASAALSFRYARTRSASDPSA